MVLFEIDLKCGLNITSSLDNFHKDGENFEGTKKYIPKLFPYFVKVYKRTRACSRKSKKG